MVVERAVVAEECALVAAEAAVVWWPGRGRAPEARLGRWRPTEEGGREGTAV